MNMKRSSAVVRFTGGETYRVAGVAVGAFCVHRTVKEMSDEDRPDWCVTHIRTGARAGCFKTKALALKAARGLVADKDANWDSVQSATDVQSWPKAVKYRLGRVIRSCGGVR